MNITLTIPDAEALTMQDRLRRAQHSKAGLPALILVVARQAAKEQTKKELEEMEVITAVLPEEAASQKAGE